MFLDQFRPFMFAPDTGDGSGGGDTGGGGEGGAPAGGAKTFAQDEVDRIVQDRLARERAKYADYEDFKTKAAKFDEVDAASKTELQKANDTAAAEKKRADDTESALKESRLTGTVLSAAAAKNIIDPSAAVALLDRSKLEYDKDTGLPTNVDAQLDALVKEKPYLVGKNGQRPAPLPGGGAPTPSDGNSMDDWMRQRAKR